MPKTDPEAASPRVDLGTIAHTLERVAWWTDRAFRIPGTKARFGLDALIGLPPVVGDAAGGVIQLGIVLVALVYYRVPKPILNQMIRNIAIDVGVGAIPILGDLFDVAFKANTRNLKLLEPYQHDRRPALAGPAAIDDPAHLVDVFPWKTILLIVALLMTLFVALVVAGIALLIWLFKH